MSIDIKEPFDGIEQTQSAWIIFSGYSDLRWLKILKPGFRHCFALLNDGQCWVSIDPLSPYTDIQIHHQIEASFDLPQWLESQGYRVVSADINKVHKKPAPWMVMTCVESIKRILGIHKFFLFTPWQLYKFLKHAQNNKKIESQEGDLSWVL